MMRARRSPLLLVSVVLTAACNDGGLPTGSNDGSAGSGGNAAAGGSGGGASGGSGTASGGSGTASGGSGGTTGGTPDALVDCAFILCAGGPCRFGSVPDRFGCPTCDCRPAQPCSSDECPPPPPVVPRCADGSTGAFICDRGESGMCGYRVECKSSACTPAECGKPPGDPNQRCGPQCSRNYAGACVWVAPPCTPPSPCREIRDRTTCEGATSCRWLEPGCVEPKLPATGCYERSDLDCTPERGCTDGRTCFKRVFNPCLPLPGNGGMCDACGSEIAICL